MREPRYSILVDIQDATERAKQGKLALYWQRTIQREYRCKKVTPAEQQAYEQLQSILSEVPQWSDEEELHHDMENIGGRVWFCYYWDALSYELKVAGVEENKIIFSPVSDMTSLSEADVLSLVITKPTLENVIYVKASAVKEGEEGHFVYLLDDSGYREAVPVTVGEKVGNHWVVTSGLSGGEKVTL